MKSIPITLSRNLLIAVLIVFTFGVAGGVSQQPEVLEVNPVIDYNPLEGFHNKSNGMFIVINGSIPEVKESLKDIVIKKAPQQSTFSVDDGLNIVVFRGVFGTGGYGINIDRVERQGNAFTVYATYSDPGKGIGVTMAVTQPVAIIPIGKLAAGDYKARLKVTRVIVEDVGIKVIEAEKELSVFNFRVQQITATPISPSINQTPSITIIQPDAGTVGTKVAITGTGFTTRDNNVAFRLAPEDSTAGRYKVGYINNLVSHDGRTIEFVIPELLGACAFPLPVTTPITACPGIGIPFKSGTQTYPVFVVNQNGTSNSVNFTVSTSPKAPGFEIFLGIVGILAVWWRLKK